MGHQIDWSATAAWIALAISIISPAITTILTNRHQLKLRELDIQEKHSSTYNAARASTIEDFISKVGKYISYSSSSARKECAESFFHIYAYTPQSLWPFLDDLNDKIESDDFAGAHELFNGIAKSLSLLIKRRTANTSIRIVHTIRSFQSGSFILYSIAPHIIAMNVTIKKQITFIFTSALYSLPSSEPVSSVANK